MIHYHRQSLSVRCAILGCVSSSIYYLICLWSAAAFLREQARRSPAATLQTLPPVSILKPLKGMDPDIYESFRSHCLQDYPEYEIIFGVSDPDDPAVASVKQLQREFPEHAIRLVVCPKTRRQREGQQSRADVAGGALSSICSSTTATFASSAIIFGASSRRWPMSASEW